MTRFDDFLKLLLGLIVAQIVKEHHQVSKNLVAMFNKTGDISAEWFPYFLLLLFLRNIHASINWDRMAGGGKFSTIMDSSTLGRVFVFLVTLTSLVGVPLVILDTLTGHTDSVSGKNLLGISLFVPFILYFVWDAILFFGSDTKRNSNEHDRVFKVVRNWLWVDGLAGLALVYIVMSYAYKRFVDESAEFLYVIESFMILSALTILVDYAINREFYFGSPVSRLPQNGIKRIRFE